MHRAPETMQSLCLHFETRAHKPPVFRMTDALVRQSYERAGSPSVTWTVNEDPDCREWMRYAQGLITSNEHLAPDAFPRDDLAGELPALRWIHIIGAGIEPLLPLDWLPPGVVLTNNSGVHWDKARESGMMALLALNGALPQLVSQQRRAEWNPIFTRGIAGRALLVIGLGDMGGAVADGAKRLGMHVTGVRLNPAPHPHADRVIGLADLDAALGGADFVVIATPLTPATHHLLDRRRLALMKPGAGLFNIGRGGCLDHDALADALATDQISGAVLDVFDPEPLPATSALWAMDNVIITPHVSADDADLYLPLTFDLVFANAARLQRGEQLLNVVNPVRGY
jgi:phosphoglycerate dehydrogenase-like enzyme